MATVLNVVFNVLVIGWSLSPWFFAAYLCAAAVIAAGILTARGKIVRKSAGAQEAQSAVQNRLFDGWDTLLIGNRYNWSRWKEVFGRTVAKAEKTESDYGWKYLSDDSGSAVDVGGQCRKRGPDDVCHCNASTAGEQHSVSERHSGICYRTGRNPGKGSEHRSCSISCGERKSISWDDPLGESPVFLR